MHWSIAAIAVSLGFGLGCGVPATPPEPATQPAGNSVSKASHGAVRATAPPADERGRYVGESIGVEYGRHRDMSNLKLPDHMVRTASLATAEGWRLVIAQRDDDLVLLLTDDDGVVLDDVAALRLRTTHKVLIHCGEDRPELIPALVPIEACGSKTGDATAERAWVPSLEGLREARGTVTCPCDLNE